MGAHVRREVFLLAACLAATACDARHGRAPPPPQATHVGTTRAARGALARRLEGVGHVEGWQRARVFAQVDGRLERVHFREGAWVRRGASLATIDPRPARATLDQVRARVAGARARVSLSRLALERALGLRKSELNAAVDVDQARAQLEGDEAALADLEAQVVAARLALEYTRVPAPIAGVAGVRLVDPGNLLRAGDANAAIVELVQMDPAAVTVSLAEDALPEVKAAMARGPLPVALTTRTGAPAAAPGEAWVLDNQIQAQSGTLRLKVRVDNPDAALWPGQFVRATLEVERREGLLLVPGEAVVPGDPAVVWTVAPGGHALAREVRVGAAALGWTEIAGGLADGEEVVVVGQHLLRQGAPVSAAPLAASDLPAAISPPAPR